MALSSKPRAEGETAFPELAVIEAAVRESIRARKPPVETSADRWDRYLAAVKAEGHHEPDEEIEKRIAALNARMGM